jgi:hypothetical protein
MNADDKYKQALEDWFVLLHLALAQLADDKITDEEVFNLLISKAVTVTDAKAEKIIEEINES